jgi:hypothetical protein
LIDEYNTLRGQNLKPGVQIAYVAKTECSVPDEVDGTLHFAISPGQIKVAKIVQITRKPDEFVICKRLNRDGTYELLLDDGAKVSAKDVVVTDGKFKPND